MAMTEREFAEWADGIAAGRIRPKDGEQRTGYLAGWNAGRLRLDHETVRGMAFELSAVQLVCFWRGYAEGQQAPPATLQQLAEADKRRAAIRARIARERPTEGR